MTKIVEILLVGVLVYLGFNVLSKVIKFLLYIGAVAVVCHLLGII